MSAPLRPVDKGSSTRLLLGATLVVAAVALALVGFVRLVTVLEGGGYGTSAMRGALIVLGVSGASFSAGIATLIWDISKRSE